MRKRPIVFLSSTVHDLRDARAELSRHLTATGCIVRASENGLSDFTVDPTVDSINSCLLNVASSDALVCIVDKRYGGVLPDSILPESMRSGGISATHAEVLHAREVGIPVFSFLRRDTVSDYGQLKKDVAAKVPWIQVRDDIVPKMVDFLNLLTKLPAAPNGRSNWYDSFESSIDLCQLVERRLAGVFRGNYGLPSELLRVSFRRPATLAVKDYALVNPNSVPLFRLVVGITIGNRNEQKVHYDALPPHPHEAILPFAYNINGIENANNENVAVEITCEYENSSGDRFKIKQTPRSPQDFFVWMPHDSDDGEWQAIV